MSVSMKKFNCQQLKEDLEGGPQIYKRYLMSTGLFARHVGLTIRFIERSVSIKKR